MELSVRTADATRWPDVEQVMGANGAYGNCWCMFWRLTNPEIHAMSPADNRAALQRAVRSDEAAGLILYAGEEPIGWCSVAPRPQFPRIFHTNGLKPDDPQDESVWSVVCVYVKQGHRRSWRSGRTGRRRGRIRARARRRGDRGLPGVRCRQWQTIAAVLRNDQPVQPRRVHP